MSSRLRSSPSVLQGKPKVTSFGSDTFYYEPEESTAKNYGRARRDNSYRFGDFTRECSESNDRRYGEKTEEDPDLLYKRSKDRFGCWDIGDIVGDSSKFSREDKLGYGIPRTRKKSLGSREEERNNSRRAGETTEKTEKESSLDAPRKGTFFGESLKIRYTDEEQRKANSSPSRVDGVAAVSTEDRRIVVGSTTIDRPRTREENEDEDDPRRHRHRHRRRYQHLFNGAANVAPRVEDTTHEDANHSIDRTRSRSVEKVSRGYGTKDPSNFREKEQRSIVGRGTAIAGVASDDANGADREEDSEDDREDDRDIDRKESLDVEPEDNDHRAGKENSSGKSDLHSVGSSRKRSKSKDAVGGEGSRLENDAARRTFRSSAYVSPQNGNPDVRIQRYERVMPESRRDSEFSGRSVSRELDRATVKRDPSSERDRETMRRVPVKHTLSKSTTKDIDSTTITRRASFKDSDNCTGARYLFKNDQKGGIKCTIKSRCNEEADKNCFEPEIVDLGKRSSVKEQRSELGKNSHSARNGEIAGKRSSLRDEHPHRHGCDEMFPRVEKIVDERRRTLRFRSPSPSLERNQSDNQRETINEKNVKRTESTKTTTAGRRRRISFKDREVDQSERNNSYGVYQNVNKDTNEEGTKRGSGCSLDDRFESFESEGNDCRNCERVLQGREKHRWKKAIDVGRGEIDSSRDHPPKECVRDSERKYDKHSRVLTPPRRVGGGEGEGEAGGGGEGGGGDDGGRGRRRGRGDKDLIRSNECWREDNRLFATRYLRENGRGADRKGSTDDEDEDDEGREPDPELQVGRSIAVNGPQDRADNRIDPDTTRRVASTIKQNGTTTIVRILTGPGAAPISRGDLERRRRRRAVQQELCLEHRRRRFDASRYDSEDDATRGEEVEGEVEKMEKTREEQEVGVVVEPEEDEEGNDDGKEHRQDPWPRSRRDDGLVPGIAGPTPSRRLWNYREGGVLITDVEEGQPCLQCGEACPGFSPHIWRKNCTSCKCPREDHDVCHEEWASVRSRLGLKADESSGPLGFSDPRERGLAWVPPGLPPHKVDEYFSMLPEISVPRLSTPGERHRDRQLAFQLPKQDLARAYCRYLDPKHASSADDFMAARNEIALDIGTVQEVIEEGSYCGVCEEPLKYGSLAVSASKLGLLYHPVCFQCTDCKELLVDLAYCVHEDAIFCERHYAEQLKPRCSACDELIFSGEYTKAMNKDWHSGHFCCWQCDESLTGQRYVLRDEHPYCIKCYESIFANGCEECNKIIGIDSKDLSYKDKHWHEACFLCNRCRVSLVDKQFGSKVDKIYCGNCYDAQFASRCDGCGEIFRAGTKKMEYKTRQWHEKCFCCVVCKNPIGTKSFIPREQEIYCASCYEDKFATRCVKCNKIITSGGVTYKNEPWHRDCFTCSNCNNSLAGQRFTSRDDKPYCADCFGELFAKRCTACSKPITGIGGTRFISFEDRHWHNECFICAGCKTSLVGRGFITDGDDIICPECAKAKLM